MPKILAPGVKMYAAEELTDLLSELGLNDCVGCRQPLPDREVWPWAHCPTCRGKQIRATSREAVIAHKKRMAELERMICAMWATYDPDEPERIH